jgi:hypothetical protein
MHPKAHGGHNVKAMAHQRWKGKRLKKSARTYYVLRFG